MSLEDLFNSIICASCGACHNDMLCPACRVNTLKANGLPEEWTDELEGLKIKSYNHGGSFQFSELYYKLKKLYERQHSERTSVSGGTT